MTMTVRVEGITETVQALGEMTKATRRNAVRRALLSAGEPTAALAASLAPVESGILAFSIAVSPQLTRRHKRDVRNEVEVHIGPAGGQGALNYASHKEFGTVLMPSSPYMRPAWESTKGIALTLIAKGLKVEVDKAAARAARKVARLAARG